MNFSLLNKIEQLSNGILATILETDGHTYKKKGEKALFTVDDPFPVYGNLGSLCVDQEVVSKGREAHNDGAPKIITVDMSRIEDVHFGSGTFCGGKMRMLLEPIDEARKAIYRKARVYLETNRPFYVAHNLQTGEVSVSESSPEPDEALYIEPVPALPDLYVFGATPLARLLILSTEDMAFRTCVIDWRTDYLDHIDSVPTIVADESPYPFDAQSLVLIISHSFERDKEALRQALLGGCRYIGLLSSKNRRDKMFEELMGNGVAAEDLKRVSSPIGIDIGGRSDPEIAISIVAELVKFRNR